MSILLKTVRIAGFRGLQNIEVELEQTTILTGMNNSGKTSFLKSLQIALGNRQFVSQDDFFIQGNTVADKIIIDLLFVPIDADKNKQCEDFSEDWEVLFTTDRVRTDGIKSFVPLRTIITFDAIKNTYKKQQFIIQDWPQFKVDEVNWFDNGNGIKTNFHFDEVPFFYMDAQRDILEDTKIRSSYIGKMLSKIEYSDEEVREIEDQIQALNDKTVSSSDILSNIKTTLKGLDSAMDSSNEGIELTPFTKKLRDLSKGLTIYYTDQYDSFSMDYHGMGTRSWSSLLTLKAFISLLSKNAQTEGSVFFPLLAIEEPEAHLHPNAQKKLYRQMEEIVGQKIISTHSPYIAATAKINQIRNFYKQGTVTCGKLDMANFTEKEIRNINRQVVNTRGEIFFSKLIVFSEGETEEQALPVFSQKYFGQTAVELGIDFIGVGGSDSYLPFLRFAEAFNIPWLIFSDAESNVVSKVKAQFAWFTTKKSESNSIVFLDDGNDFEKQLLADEYISEIKKAIVSFDVYNNEQHRYAKEPDRLIEVDSYNNEQLDNAMEKIKAKFGPVIAEIIVKSDRNLPPKVIELCHKIKAAMKIAER